MRKLFALFLLAVLITVTAGTAVWKWDTITSEVELFIDTVDQWENATSLETDDRTPSLSYGPDPGEEADLPASPENFEGDPVRTIYGTTWLLSGVRSGELTFGREDGSGRYLWKEEAQLDGVTIGDPAETVQDAWGAPEQTVKRGRTNVSFPAEHYDLYVRNNEEIAVFYDRHEGNVVKSIYVVSSRTTSAMESYYADASDWKDESQAKIMVALINNDRITRGLEPLTWNEELVPVAEAHSKDMNRRDYFSHTNPDGQGPADRVREAGISFRMIGENLAHGQSNAVYAHEGLMDSKGHRDNILNPRYKEVAIGIDVDEKGAPYFTVLFYTGR